MSSITVIEAESPHLKGVGRAVATSRGTRPSHCPHECDSPLGDVQRSVKFFKIRV